MQTTKALLLFLHYSNSNNFTSHGYKIEVMMSVYKKVFFKGKMERMQHQLALAGAADHSMHHTKSKQLVFGDSEVTRYLTI